MHGINNRASGHPDKGKFVFRRVAKNNLNGQDKPFPVRRHTVKQDSTAIDAREHKPRTMLKAGSLLALRFPQLYVQQLADEATLHCKGRGSDQRELMW